jgi:GT2 family glycosyltransferase
MHLEQRGRDRLEKIFKVSEPLASISIAADDARSGTRIDRIDVVPLGRFSVAAFLAAKGLRFAASNRGRLDLAYAWNHFRAALRPRASFVFQARYGGQDDVAAYARWRAFHESPAGLELVKADLARKLSARDGASGRANRSDAVRIALIVGNGIDCAKAQFGLGAQDRIEIVPVSVDDLLAPQIAGERRWDFALPVDRGGRFAAAAVERMLLDLIDNPDAEAVFADSDTIGRDGKRRTPVLKPPLWDKELLWSSDYIKAPLLMRWNPKITDALSLPGAACCPSYALALMLSASFKQRELRHIPAILFHEDAALSVSTKRTEREKTARREKELTILTAHLGATGHPGAVETRSEGTRIAWPLPHGVQTSIIIPSKDNPELLATCIDSIKRVTRGLEPEIIVADNGSVKPATKAYLRALELKGTATVVPCPGPFNFSKINNDARRHASGDILVFLNDDTRVISDDWLVELVSLAVRPEIGAVGALLLYPDRTVQHAGILLGIRGIADHAFRHESGAAAGYLDLLRCRREVTAVTGACLAVSATDFDAVGGFDEALAVTANDVDLCLRLRARGLTNIWTPWSVLEHAESKSRGVASTNAALDRQRQETGIFNARWGHLLDRDPTYNPGLSRVAPDFSLGIE